MLVDQDAEAHKRMAVALMNRYDMRPSVAGEFLAHVDREAVKFTAPEYDDIPDTPEQRALIAAHNADIKRKHPGLVDLDAQVALIREMVAALGRIGRISCVGMPESCLSWWHVEARTALQSAAALGYGPEGDV